MPLLQYKCPNCSKSFDELVKRFDCDVFCPVCGTKCLRNYAGEVFSSTGKTVKKCSGNCKTCGGCK